LKKVLQHILEQKAQRKKMLALLIDPDKLTSTYKNALKSSLKNSKPDLFLYGGSLMVSDQFENGLNWLKQNFPDTFIIIFPGDNNQISPIADALLLLSVVSGRNADLLIGKHVNASFNLKRSGLELLSTAYLLVDGGSVTTANYMSFSAPIPANKPEIAAATALAAEQLGMQLAYFDAGSGAKNNISPEFIKTIKEYISLPIVVGGGIKNEQTAYDLWKAGADIIVIGNLFEQDPSLITGFFNALVSAENVVKI